MGDVLGKLGGGGGGKAIEAGLTGAGLIGNILAGRERGREADILRAQQQKFLNLTPEQLSAMVLRAERPLEQGLIQNVGNVVQGQLAERGLAQAPGIYAASLAQGLAPYELTQREMALKEVLTMLGLPLEYAKGISALLPPKTDLAPLLRLLFSRDVTRSPGLTPDIPIEDRPTWPWGGVPPLSPGTVPFIPGGI